MFITGYDSIEKVFFAYDNFLEGRYQFKKISFVNLVKSYEMLTSDKTMANCSETRRICFLGFNQKLKPLDKDQLYCINMETIINEIWEYLMLKGYASGYRNITHYVYGVECYDELFKILEYGIISEEHFADHRAFSSMRDRVIIKKS